MKRSLFPDIRHSAKSVKSIILSWYRPVLEDPICDNQNWEFFATSRSKRQKFSNRCTIISITQINFVDVIVRIFSSLVLTQKGQLNRSKIPLQKSMPHSFGSTIKPTIPF